MQHQLELEKVIGSGSRKFTLVFDRYFAKESSSRVHIFTVRRYHVHTSEEVATSFAHVRTSMTVNSNAAQPEAIARLLCRTPLLVCPCVTLRGGGCSLAHTWSFISGGGLRCPYHCEPRRPRFRSGSQRGDEPSPFAATCGGLPGQRRDMHCAVLLRTHGVAFDSAPGDPADPRGT
jgi:hypothetical protein